jgi:tetratricopeptide (TPR) repeat protein
MRRLMVLSAFLFIFLLGAVPALAAGSSQGVEGHIQAGIRYYEQGHSEVYADLTKLNKALDEFKQALKLDPNNAEAHYRIGLTCLAMDVKPCAEKQYRVLRDLDAEKAKALHVRIVAYKPPTRFERVGPLVVPGSPPAPAAATPTEAPPPSGASAGGADCEIVEFSTSEKPGEIRRFADGGTVYEGPKQCVTATIKNTSASRAWAKDYTIVAKFSDGDKLSERISDGIKDMDEVQPGQTVTGTACFSKEKATITVVECDTW